MILTLNSDGYLEIVVEIVTCVDIYGFDYLFLLIYLTGSLPLASCVEEPSQWVLTREQVGKVRGLMLS